MLFYSRVLTSIEWYIVHMLKNTHQYKPMGIDIFSEPNPDRDMNLVCAQNIFLMHFCPGTSQLIQIYSVDWTDVYDTQH